MIIEMTSLSAASFEKAADKNLSSVQALEYLEKEIIMHSFLEILQNLRPGENIREQLTEGFIRLDPEVKKESIDKKVRSWCAGKHTPTEREDYFKIAFILKLNERETNKLLTAGTDSTIHYRNIRELVYAFCLRNGKSYEHAHMILAELPSDGKALPAEAVKNTQQILHDLSSVSDENILKSYIRENISSFGTMHATAYKYFRYMLELLKTPSQDEDGEYSYLKVAQTYFQMNVPVDKKTAGYTALQKTIKQFWPNDSTLKKMSEGTEDVSRKVLMLLYIITEGDYSGEYVDEDEDYFTDEEKFHFHYSRLNLLLSSCGMSVLDPRNSFDWLVIYSFRLEYVQGDSMQMMSERMDKVLEMIFSDMT